MHKWLILPPVVFVIVLAVSWLFSKVMSVLAFKPDSVKHGTGESYACGEENYDQAAQPDYSVFFPFAFFFTIAHVAALIMATTPAGTRGVFMIAVLYLSGAVMSLYILFRKQAE